MGFSGTSGLQEQDGDGQDCGGGRQGSLHQD